MEELNEAYWTNRYKEGKAGWDVGHVSTPLKEYFDQLTDKSISILIPGAGNAHEAEYLFRSGFKNVWVVDISKAPLIALKERVSDFPEEQLIHGDFFNFEGEFDLIVEQTFFCALNPALRQSYVRKMKSLLKPKGKLVGVLFKIHLENSQPPFGATETEYRGLFEKLFDIEVMEEAYNSITPRAGSELFVKMLPRIL